MYPSPQRNRFELAQSRFDAQEAVTRLLRQCQEVAAPAAFAEMIEVAFDGSGALAMRGRRKTCFGHLEGALHAVDLAPDMAGGAVAPELLFNLPDVFGEGAVLH